MACFPVWDIERDRDKDRQKEGGQKGGRDRKEREKSEICSVKLTFPVLFLSFQSPSQPLQETHS
jgi:hypothetical protein